MSFTTPDLYDQWGESLQISEPGLQHYGGQQRFFGQIATVKCFEDNSKVGECVRSPGNGRVLVVDGGGSPRRALLGDMLAQHAVDNGWAGIVIYGCLRDVEEIVDMPIGVMALGATPRKTEKLGEGQTEVPVSFCNLRMQPGDWLYADVNGIAVADRALLDADGKPLTE